MFVDKHFWIIDINKDFVNISLLESFEGNEFEGSFQMAYYFDPYGNNVGDNYGYVGLFHVIMI